jgi:hypothetical protein
MARKVYLRFKKRKFGKTVGEQQHDIGSSAGVQHSILLILQPSIEHFFVSFLAHNFFEAIPDPSNNPNKMKLTDVKLALNVLFVVLLAMPGMTAADNGEKVRTYIIIDRSFSPRSFPACCCMYLTLIISIVSHNRTEEWALVPMVSFLCC